MTNRRYVLGYLFALFLAGATFSCSDDPLISPIPEAHQIQTVNDGDYQGEVISLELAKQVAEHEVFQQVYFAADSTQASKGGRVGSPRRTVKQAITFKDKHNQPAVHVMAYEQGGFAILSAEKEYEAVLAIGDEGVVDVNQMPEVVKNWLGENQASIEEVRTTRRGARQSGQSQRSSWNDLLATTGLAKADTRGAKICDDCPTPDPDPNPSNTCTQVGSNSFFGPLLKTQWDQSGGNVGSSIYSYNSFTPNGALAGCGPVAALQLMAYWKHPATYYYPSSGNQATVYWDSMLKYPYKASFYLANLLRYFGDYAHSEWGAYPGTETSTKTDNIASALRNNFGYGTAYVVEGPTMQDILGELNTYHPVLLRGSKYSGGSEAHIWVCDGYMYQKFYCYPNYSNVYWLHMNWGWGGWWNGYYSDSYSSSTGGTTYYDDNKNKQHMPDSNPNHNNNSDVFAFGRKMIRVAP